MAARSWGNLGTGSSIGKLLESGGLWLPGAAAWVRPCGGRFGSLELLPEVWPGGGCLGSLGAGGVVAGAAAVFLRTTSYNGQST